MRRRSRNEAMFSVMYHAGEKPPENLTHEEVMAQRSKQKQSPPDSTTDQKDGPNILQQIDQLKSAVALAERLREAVSGLLQSEKVLEERQVDLLKENAELKDKVAQLEAKVTELEQRILNESCKPDRAEEFRRRAMQALEKISFP